VVGRLQPDARSQRRHASPRSAEAIHTVRRICNEEFADRVELRIVDVGEQPALLTGAGGAPIVDAPAGDVSGHDIDPATPLPIDLMSPSSPRRRTGHHRRGGSEWPHPPPECWSVGSPCGFLSLCSSGFRVALRDLVERQALPPNSRPVGRPGHRRSRFSFPSLRSGRARHAAGRVFIAGALSASGMRRGVGVRIWMGLHLPVSPSP
jgi:hypothetical protein